ncbi:MAG: UvrB/UvrC motif-containing protein [bacterium]|nr:UvrB/UvrC motif-containing protein [bacterium]
MIWANFLHIYQPITQSPDILEGIVNQSYRPLFKGLKKIPGAKINLNISAALSELLIQYDYHDVIEDIIELAKSGKVEFTESARYHSFLPMLPEEEIERQIRLNNESNKKIFGKDVYKPVGFFPPEMAYSYKIAKVVKKLGYEWMILDEIAACGKVDAVEYDKIYTVSGLNNFKVFFRERRPSNLIMSAVVRSAESLKEVLREEVKTRRYLLTAMDGETFGHHRPGLEKLLFGILASPIFKKIFISEIPKYFPKEEKISLVESTWASSEEDIEKKEQFLSWNDPENEIHALQWAFFDFVLSKIKKSDELETSEGKKARENMDIAEASDHFWWASAKPWWSIEMIEQGAWQLLETLKFIPHVAMEDVERAEAYYKDIVVKAFYWQRSGKVKHLAREMRSAIKIPFKERTLEAGKPEVYAAFIETMKKEMKKAAKKMEYEKAVLWRDAIWKLETKNDIYDAVHAVDLLRQEIPLVDLEKSMDKYKEEYKRKKSGQPEDRRI